VGAPGGGGGDHEQRRVWRVEVSEQPVAEGEVESRRDA